MKMIARNPILASVLALLFFAFSAGSVAHAQGDEGFFANRKYEMTPEGQQQFMDEFAAQDGVIKRPSGLLIHIVSRGKGTFPRHGQTVSVQYEGRTADGRVFDSSYARGGAPASFGVDAVIKGWTEALVLMTEGSKWEIAVPADLAYGDQGAGDRIPPNTNLFFTVELIAVHGPKR